MDNTPLEPSKGSFKAIGDEMSDAKQGPAGGTAQPVETRESLENRLEFETLVSDLSARFVNLPSDRIDSEIEDSLRRVCQFLGLEALWNEGPVSVLAEYNRAWVNSPASGFPTFYGYYITGSWVLTGETRPYDRTVGYARRVIPTDHWGAPELVVRFSHEDLVSGVVQGGSFNKTYLGMNWWATRRWKMGFGWGHT